MGAGLSDGFVKRVGFVRILMVGEAGLGVDDGDVTGETLGEWGKDVFGAR